MPLGPPPGAGVPGPVLGVGTAEPPNEALGEAVGWVGAGEAVTEGVGAAVVDGRAGGVDRPRADDAGR